MIRMPATMHALSLRRFQNSCEIVIEKSTVEFCEVCTLSMNAGREGRTPVRPRHRRCRKSRGCLVACDDCVNDLFARCANGRTGVRPSRAAATFLHGGHPLPILIG